MNLSRPFNHKINSYVVIMTINSIYKRDIIRLFFKAAWKINLV